MAKRRADAAGSAAAEAAPPTLLIASIPDDVVATSVIGAMDLEGAQHASRLSRAWRDACRRRCAVIVGRLVDALPAARLVIAPPLLLLGHPVYGIRLARPDDVIGVRYMPTYGELATTVPAPPRGDDVAPRRTRHSASYDDIRASVVRVDDDAAGADGHVRLINQWRALMAAFQSRVIQLVTSRDDSVVVHREAAHCLFWLREFVHDRWHRIDARFALDMHYAMDRYLVDFVMQQQ